MHHYTRDETAWCGLFVAICAKRVGYPIARTPLWALSWATSRANVREPMLGDILVFERKSSTP